MRRSVDSVLSEQTRNLAAMARRGPYRREVEPFTICRCAVYDATAARPYILREIRETLEIPVRGSTDARQEQSVQINPRPMRPRGTRPNRTEKQCQCAVPPPAHRWGALVDLTSGTGPCRTVTSICRIVQHSYCIVLNGT